MESVNFDKIWLSVGETGRYQMFVYAILVIPTCFVDSWAAFTNVFLLHVPAHSCNDTFQNCEYGSLNACASWDFDDTDMISTAATKFGLICEQRYLSKTFLIAIATLIAIVGSVIFGNLQDHIGRKPVTLILVTIYIAAFFPSAFLNNFHLFIAVRWLGYFAQVSALNTGYLYALEFTGASRRTIVGACMCMMYAFAAMVLGVVAYFFNDSYSYNLATSIPFVIFYALYPFLEESPRWLVSKGRQEEAIKVIHRVASRNGKKNISRELAQILFLENRHVSYDPKAMRKKEEQKGSWQILKLFRGQKMLSILLMVTFAWMTILVTFTAIAYNVKNIGGNFFLTYVLQAFTEIPAVLLNIPIITRFGRIIPLSLSLIMSGVCSLLAAVFQHFAGSGALPVVFAIATKFGICVAYGVIMQLATELYPTEVRGLALGFTTFVAGLANLAMPYIVHSAETHVVLPMVIMGAMCCCGGVVVFALPETKFRPMLETLRQVEKYLPGRYDAFLENWAYLRKRKRNDQTEEDVPLET